MFKNTFKFFLGKLLNKEINVRPQYVSRKMNQVEGVKKGRVKLIYFNVILLQKLLNG